MAGSPIECADRLTASRIAGSISRSRPSSATPCRMTQSSTAGARPGPLGHADEGAGRDGHVAVDQADQRLGAGDPAGVEVEQRLEVQLEVVVLQGGLDPGLPLHPRARARLHRRAVVEHGEPVAPGILGVVHQHVGQGQHVLGALGRAGEGDHADAGGDPAVDALERAAVGAHPLDHGIGDLLRGLAVGVGQQDGELVTTEPGDEVLLAQRPPQHRRGRHDQLVAGVVAPGVVDLLEVVEVEQQQGAARAGAGAQVEVLGQGRVEATTVGQPGEHVVVGEVGQALLVAPTLGEVDDVDQDDLVLAVLRRR